MPSHLNSAFVSVQMRWWDAPRVAVSTLGAPRGLTGSDRSALETKIQSQRNAITWALANDGSSLSRHILTVHDNTTGCAKSRLARCYALFVPVHHRGLAQLPVPINPVPVLGWRGPTREGESSCSEKSILSGNRFPRAPHIKTKGNPW